MSDPRFQPGFGRGLAELLAALDVRTLGSLAIALATTAVLDAIAVATDGVWLPVVRVALGSIPESEGPCSVWATDRTASAPDAAFVNGVMMHATLRDDVGSGGFAEGTHPGSFVIPAALAVAEEHDIDGVDVLSAVVAGYEAAARIAATASREVLARGYHSVPVIGVFGAAAAAGKALGLKAAGFETAFGLAAHMSGGLAHGRFEGTMEPDLHPGIAARSGVHAALLARSGAVVTPGVLEPDGLFFTLSGVPAAKPSATGLAVGDLALGRVRHKTFPVNGPNEATMRLILTSQAGQAPLSEPDIESVIVRRPGAGANRIDRTLLRGPPYENMAQAQISAKFTTMASLLGRPVGDLAYYSQCYGDPDVAALIDRCRFVAHDGTDIDVEVRLRSGETLRFHDDCTAPPWDPALVPSKFRDLARPVLGDQVDAVERGVNAIKAGGSLRPLLRKLRIKP